MKQKDAARLPGFIAPATIRTARFSGRLNLFLSSHVGRGLFYLLLGAGNLTLVPLG
jgi:hypothetical protein